MREVRGQRHTDMRVLLACEESQEVTKALRANGHHAYSCDLKPCSGGYPEWHLQMDVFEAIELKPWDAALFFPECTFLTSSAEWAYKDGPYHQKVKQGTLVGEKRRKARKEQIEFVKKLWSSKIRKKAIENPVGVLSTKWSKPNQYIQPYEFGEDASKNTCLWIDGFPLLKPTKYVQPRVVNGKNRWGNQTDSGQNKLSPDSKRSETRSKTYQGIAKAIADQWFPNINLNNKNYERQMGILHRQKR